MRSKYFEIKMKEVEIISYSFEGSDNIASRTESLGRISIGLRAKSVLLAAVN
jgi:hypothetical protein